MKGVAKDFLEMSCHFKNIDSFQFLSQYEGGEGVLPPRGSGACPGFTCILIV